MKSNEFLKENLRFATQDMFFSPYLYRFYTDFQQDIFTMCFEIRFMPEENWDNGGPDHENRSLFVL